MKKSRGEHLSVGEILSTGADYRYSAKRPDVASALVLPQ